jgi:hypothetical protein
MKKGNVGDWLTDQTETKKAAICAVYRLDSRTLSAYTAAR